jgi:2-methylcitrate dehydratase
MLKDTDDTGLGAVIDWVARFDDGQLTGQVRAAARTLLADAAGCAIAGSDEPVVASLKAALGQAGATGRSSVIGTGACASLTDAILLNGAMVRAQDFNDAYVMGDMVGHPSDNIPALLAVAEQAGTSGRRLLTAIVLCYEVYCRLIDELSPDSDWDHTAASAIALPLSLGWMIGLDRPALRAAVSLSASFARPSAEVRRGQLSAAKAIANAVVAATSCTLTYAAASGLTGPAGGMGGHAGWLHTVGKGVDLERAFLATGAHWKVQDVSLKAFPCIGTAQGAVAAAIQAHRVVAAIAPRAYSVHIDVPESALVKAQLADQDRWHPKNRETADHSIPYLAAVALIDGEICERQYEERRWEDPKVAEAMSVLTISTAALEGIQPTGARLTVTTGDGEQAMVEVEAAPGHPRNPIGGAAFQERFTRNAAKLLSPGQALDLLSWIDSIDEQASVADCMKLLAGS